MNKPFGRAATAKAALLITGSTYISFSFGLVVSAVIARGIGPTNFGHYSYAIWLSGIFLIIANNGLTSTTLRFISEMLGNGRAEIARKVHGWLLRRQHIGFLVALCGFLLTLPLSLPPDWSMSIVVFLGVIIVSLAAKTYYIFEISAAKGYGHFIVEATSTTVMSALNLVVVLILSYLHASVVAYLVLFAIANVGYYSVARGMLKARGIVASTQPLNSELASRVQNHLGWTILLAAAGAFGNKAAETYLLSRFVGPAEVGYFAIAAALTRGGVELLAAGLNSVLMPLMAHGFGQGGSARVHAILSDSVRLFAFGGLLLAGVGYFWAEPAVMLIYGSKYQSAIIVFQVMILVAGLTLSQSAFGALLSTTDNQKIRAGVSLGSVVISVLSAILLVPKFGLTGAVISHAASSCLIFVATSVGIVKVFDLSLPWREVSRLLLSAALAAIVSSCLLLLGSSLPVILFSGAFYAVVYIASTILFRAWRSSDYIQLRPLAVRYPETLGRILFALESWANR